MTTSPEIIVFSDLDGTLLDHSTYTWEPASDALQALRSCNGGLVLATSKTAAEVAPIRSQMGFADWPAIIENGGGLLEPHSDPYTHHKVYADIRRKLRDLPRGFEGFGDMSAEKVAEITGLTLSQAQSAKKRFFTEPGLWNGPESGLDTFLEAAGHAGLVARRGGRFLTLSFGLTKADQMDILIERYRPRLTIALGDAPNDTEMLEKADHGVIVANPSAPALPPLPGEATGRIQRTRLDGPRGWCEAVSAILKAQTFSEDATDHG